MVYHPAYYAAIQEEPLFLNAAEYAEDYKEFSGQLEVGVSEEQRLITRRNKLTMPNVNFVGWANANIRLFTRTWFIDVLRIFNRIFDEQTHDEVGENAYKIAYVYFKIRIFNDKMLFPNAISTILLMAKYAPSLLYRIITLHDTPDSPNWLDEKRMCREYRECMDAASTPEEKADVIRIKERLCGYFYYNAELDTPDEEVSEWMGLDEE